MNGLVPIAGPRIPLLMTPARCGGRRRHQAGQPQLPDNRGSPLSQERRHIGKAAVMANHALTRPTRLHDRRRDEVSFDKVERVLI
jgi:hypothetical protein